MDQKPTRQSLDDKLLSYLKESAVINKEVADELGISDLPSRISRLRKIGHNIKSVSEKGVSCTYVYSEEIKEPVDGMFKPMTNPIF